MKENVCSKTERIVRVIIGLALLSLFFFLNGAERWWGVLGFVPLATVYYRYCPLNQAFGVDTCRMKTASAKH